MSLTKQQLKDRKKGLFGTDASMADGTNDYHDEYYLYKVKRGEWDDRIEPAPHLDIGHELEDYIARSYTKRTGNKVRRDNRTVWSKKHLYNGKPFMGCHVDRRVVGKKRILECKTAYSRNKWGKDGSGIIPLNYRSQIKHYCLVLGIHEADLAVLFMSFPPTLEIHSFDFSDIELHSLLAKERTIWNKILLGIEPDVGYTLSTNHKLREEFPESSEDLIISTTDINKAVNELKDIKSGIKDLSEAKLRHANKIIHHMKEGGVLVDHEGDEIATFKTDSKGVRKLLIK